MQKNRIPVNSRNHKHVLGAFCTDIELFIGFFERFLHTAQKGIPNSQFQRIFRPNYPEFCGKTAKKSQQRWLPEVVNRG